MNVREPSSNVTPNRRQVLQAMGLTCCAVPWLDRLASTVLAADTPPARNGFPRMVHEFFVHEVRQANTLNAQRYRDLQSREDAEKYVGSVRQAIRECFGPEPERTELNPRITGVLKRDAYTIEKIIFDSRPGFPVTANLYLPTGGDQPRPGVVGTCGHSTNGKAEKAYQSFAQGLARLGYVCLIYDPIGQGERLQYVDDDLKSWVGVGVREHLYAGNQQFLVGEFLGMWRAWDGIRALDYSAHARRSRPAADRRHRQLGRRHDDHLAVRRRAAVDDGGAQLLCHHVSPQHGERTARRHRAVPAQGAGAGPGPRRLSGRQAPDPVLILAKERDYFDVRGNREALWRLKRLYRLLGHEDNISLFVGPTTHGYTQENREAMYQWFDRATGGDHGLAEPEITLEKDETCGARRRARWPLWKAPRRSFSSRVRSRSSWLSSARAQKERPCCSRGPRAVEAEPGSSAARSTSRQLAALPHPSLAPRARVPAALRLHLCGRDRTAHAGDRVHAQLRELVLAPAPTGQSGRAVRVASFGRSGTATRTAGARSHRGRAGGSVLHCDVRGIGESLPNTCGGNSFDNPYGCDYFYAIHSLMLDRPYLGQKAHDVLRVLAWLKGNGYDNVHLVGKGWGALAATFAALLADNVSQVTLKNALQAYAVVAESEQYDWPLATVIPNVLAHFDLPDCYRALESKQLRQLAPWDAQGEKTT